MSKIHIECRLHEAAAKRTVPNWNLQAWRSHNTKIFGLIKNSEDGCLKDKIVLNVGCGRDVFFEFFKQEKAMLVELDLVVDVLRENKQRGAESVIVADVFHLPFKSHTFDIVFCLGLLHHLARLDFGLSEMVRVLKRGATIFCVEPNKDYLASILLNLAEHCLHPRLRAKIIPLLVKSYVAPAEYERGLSSGAVLGWLQKLDVSSLVKNYNTSANYILPKVLSVFWDTVLNKLVSKMPSTIQIYFAFEFMIWGKKEGKRGVTGCTTTR